MCYEYIVSFRVVLIYKPYITAYRYVFINSYEINEKYLIIITFLYAIFRKWPMIICEILKNLQNVCDYNSEKDSH